MGAMTAFTVGSEEMTELPETSNTAEAVINFAVGLPGFPRARRFLLQDVSPGRSPVSKMTSLDQEGLQFIVVPPGLFFPDYHVTVDEDTQQRIGLSKTDDAVVLVILTLSPGEVPTANLLGPIVINAKNLEAAQVVQVASNYRAAEPLRLATQSKAASMPD
jgi:flagellar assembly factor FliW